MKNTYSSEIVKYTGRFENEKYQQILLQLNSMGEELKKEKDDDFLSEKDSIFIKKSLQDYVNLVQ